MFYSHRHCYKSATETEQKRSFKRTLTSLYAWALFQVSTFPSLRFASTSSLFRFSPLILLSLPYYYYYLFAHSNVLVFFFFEMNFSPCTDFGAFLARVGCSVLLLLFSNSTLCILLFLSLLLSIKFSFFFFFENFYELLLLIIRSPIFHFHSNILC